MNTDARGYPILPPSNPATMAEIIRRQCEAHDLPAPGGSMGCVGFVKPMEGC